MKKIEITRKALALIIRNSKGSLTERAILAAIKEGVGEHEFCMALGYASSL